MLYSAAVWITQPLYLVVYQTATPRGRTIGFDTANFNNSALGFAICSSEFDAREKRVPGPVLVRTGSSADGFIARIGGLEGDKVACEGVPGKAFARSPSSFASELALSGGPDKVLAPDRSSLAPNLVHAACRGSHGAGPQGPCYGGGQDERHSRTRVRRRCTGQPSWPDNRQGPRMRPHARARGGFRSCPRPERPGLRGRAQAPARRARPAVQPPRSWCPHARLTPSRARSGTRAC